MRRLRLGDLRKLFADRCRGIILPDDDAGRDYLKELLLPISLGAHEGVKRPAGMIQIWGPIDRMLHEIESWAPWMEEDEAQEVLEEIDLMPAWQRKPKAKTLGERLNVSYPERARLQLRTIGPCDVTEAGMVLLRKQKSRQRMRRRRLLNGARSQSDSTARTKPWLVKGISRRTYYYRLKHEQSNCTTSCAINLTKTGYELVQKIQEGKEGKEGIVSVFPPATPAGQIQTCADGFLSADDSAWLVDAISPLPLSEAA
jgi:hypothetical protein